MPLRRFGLKTGINFAHFGQKSGFREIYRECINVFTVSILIRRKEKYTTSKRILRKLFCWRSNVSNDDIIPKRPRSENGYKK